jgi:catechol 2,3-dioxygenase
MNAASTAWGDRPRSPLASSGETSAVVEADADERLPAATRLGAVELRVTDVERSVAFYTESIGLREHRREDASVALGAGAEDLLVLVGSPAARPAGRHAGLYHVALLYPTREDLAVAALRLASTRTRIQGAADHETHEAIYLADPDGNGLELAADRARELWPDVGDESLYAGGPRPLDLDGLLSLAGGGQLPPNAARGLRVGHVHLHVADTEAALAFYSRLVGFEKVVQLGDSAAFVSAGGYHHHLAFNVWRGVGVPAAPAGAVGLVRWTVHVPREGDVGAVRARLDRAGVPYERRGAALLVRDPSGNAMLLGVDPTSGERPSEATVGAPDDERARGDAARA